MSVILKALRSQQEEGAADPPAGGDLGASSFQMDSTTPGPTQGGGSGSNKRTIVLAIILAASLIVLLVSMVMRGRSEGPSDEPPPTPKLAQPAPAVAPAVTPVTPVPVSEGPNTDLQVARSQYKAGEYDESIKSFQKALDKDPNNASIHNDFGLALLKKELFTSAENHFAKAMELDDNCAECYNNLGYLKTILNQPVEAEKYLQKAIALQPSSPDAYFNLGVMYEKNGDVGKAVAAYRDFLKRLPKSETDMAAKVKDRIQELSGD